MLIPSELPLPLPRKLCTLGVTGPKCIGNGYGECEEQATYIRHTQFAGSHPLCDKHAMEDEDFLTNDSYLFMGYSINVYG